MTTGQTFVIAGAGLAGAKAAETLRAEGFDGRIVLAGDEPHRPYERPPLSKQRLGPDPGGTDVHVHAEGFYAERDIELRLGCAVVDVDVPARTVTLADGSCVRFDRLLLAPGAEPRRLDAPGADLPGVHLLRTLDDADALRAGMERGGPLVVVGAGWIGTEVAAAARTRGLDVTLLDVAALPLERVLGPEVGAIFRDIHADHGVRMLPRTGVAAFEGHGRVERVVTSDGRRLECDLAVVAVGVTPRVDLARRAGLDVGDGILVDATLRTRAPAVFAAGDVAAAEHPLLGTRLRVEHWANALHGGPVAAQNMLGRAVPHDRLPYFFSDQYDVGMEFCGHAPAWDRVVLRGDPASRNFMAFWLGNGRVLAGMSVNVWGVVERIEELVRSGAPVDAERLSDPAVPLDAVAQGAPAA